MRSPIAAVLPYGNVEDDDFPAHVATYEAFLRGIKIAVVLIMVTLALMAIFLT